MRGMDCCLLPSPFPVFLGMGELFITYMQLVGIWLESLSRIRAHCDCCSVWEIQWRLTTCLLCVALYVALITGASDSLFINLWGVRGLRMPGVGWGDGVEGIIQYVSDVASVLQAPELAAEWGLLHRFPGPLMPNTPKERVGHLPDGSLPCRHTPLAHLYLLAKHERLF